MISVCVRPRHIYSHIQTCTMGDALKLFEDMFSVDFSQNRTGTRFRGHHKLLCRHIQEIFFSDWYYLFKFSADFWIFQWYQPVPVHSSSVIGASKRPEATTVIVLPKFRLSFKRWSCCKTCISMERGNETQISEYSSGTSQYQCIVLQLQVC